MSDAIRGVHDYPAEQRETVQRLRTIQKRIDRRERENEADREERDTIIDGLIADGMGPKEALDIVGMGRNAYYQRLKRRA